MSNRQQYLPEQPPQQPSYPPKPPRTTGSLFVVMLMFLFAVGILYRLLFRR